VTAQVHIVRSREEFADLAEAWNELLAEMPGANPFLAHQWLSAWIDTVGADGRPYVAVLREGQRLRAAAPLVEQRCQYYGLPATELCFIGNVTSDRVQFLARPDDLEAHHAIWNHLREATGWNRLVRLEEVPSDSPTAATAPAAGSRVGRESSSDLPFVPLNGEPWPEFEKRLKKKFRTEMRTRFKVFDTWGEWELQFLRGAWEVAPRLDAMIELETASAKQSAGYAFFGNAANIEFMRRVLNAGSPLDPLLTQLMVDGSLVAHLLGFIQHGVYCAYNIAYRPGHEKGSPGKWLLCRTIEHGLEIGLTGVDILRGATSMKRLWDPQMFHNERIVLFPANPIHRLAKLAVFDIRPRLKSRGIG